MTRKGSGFFITVEGIEGVGKSTCVQWIKSYLSQQQVDFEVTREPGGTAIAEQIRDIVLTQQTEVLADDTELLLMFAARAQHLAQVIWPALHAGKWVVSDRFTDASYAYQGGGRGIDPQRIQVLEQWVQGDLQPDVTLLLDAPLEIALERMRQRRKLDRIEAQEQQFFDKVRKMYLTRAHAEPERFYIIDAAQSIEQVQQKVFTILENVTVS